MTNPTIVKSLLERMLDAAEKEPQFSANELLSASMTLAQRVSASCVGLSIQKPETQKEISEIFARLSLEFMPTNGTKQ